MKALTWQGKRSVSVEEVPDPVIQEPTDAIIRITSTAICGSDLHLYEVLGPYMHKGDVLGHEPMGIVEEVGSGVTNLAKGDRVVIPFNISCGRCYMCSQGLQSQCETTQVRKKNSGAALFGFSELYGSVPGGQAEYLRVPHADYGPVKVGQELPDERYLFLSDILPTAWQGVKYADVAGRRDAGGASGWAPWASSPPDRNPPGPARHRRGSGPGAPRDGRAARRRVLDYTKDVADELREMTGRPRPRRRGGRRRHGSARFARGGVRAPRAGTAAGQAGAKSHGDRRAWTGSRRCTRPLTPSGAAAPCPSAACTAARPAPCRC